MKLRTVLFWIHLAVGVVVGLVVLNMSVSGMIMAFEPQIVAFAERDVRHVPPPAPNAPRLALGALVARVRAQVPTASVTAVTVTAEPTAAVSLNLGREAGTVYVNPYNGDVLGKGSKVHDWLHDVEAWHRRLSTAPTGDAAERRPIGRTLTGSAAVAMSFMAVSGLYLWWPRTSSGKPVVFFRRGLRGRARDFNWHNVAGLWCAGLLLVSTATGVVMSFRWANDLVYRVAGGTPPPARGSDARAERSNEAAVTPDLDALWTRAESQAPDFVSITMRLPRRGSTVNVSIVEAGAHPHQRSTLTLDGATAAVVKWEPFSAQSRGRRWRAWVRPVHTGEAAGLPGQMVAFTGASGATLLVATGFALSLRRLAAWARLLSSHSDSRNASRSARSAGARLTSGSLVDSDNR